MINPFDFFSEIYCVNLPERTDRWESAQQEFKKVNIQDKVTRFEGYQFNNTQEKNVLLGRAGCFCSFREIVRIAKEKNLENVLIFEDDVQFLEIDNPNKQTIEKHLIFDILNRSLETLSNSWLDDWSIFYLGMNLPSCNNPILKPISKNLFRVAGSTCCHAFALNKNIFDTILKRVPGDKDGMINWLQKKESFDGYLGKVLAREFNAYCVYPMLATQRPSWSNIDTCYSKGSDDLSKNFYYQVENLLW